MPLRPVSLTDYIVLRLALAAVGHHLAATWDVPVPQTHAAPLAAHVILGLSDPERATATIRGPRRMSYCSYRPCLSNLRRLWFRYRSPSLQTWSVLSDDRLVPVPNP